MGTLKYKISVRQNTVFKYRWMKEESIKKFNKPYEEYPEDKLVKAFCVQQGESNNPEDEWYIPVDFVEENDNASIFPYAIPLWMVMGKINGSEILFDLDENTQIRVVCDQTSSPYYNPCRFGDDEEDPAYKTDSFAAAVCRAMNSRMSNPYMIDYDKMAKEENARQAEESERLSKLLSYGGEVKCGDKVYLNGKRIK